MTTFAARLLGAAALVLTCSAALGGDLVVIVSARSSVEALRADQAAAIFLGQSARFPGGAVATALDQPIGSNERDQFYLRVTGKTPALLKAHWSKLVFTGRGQPPRELADSAAVRRAVAEDPGLVGYIEREALDPSVRQVLLVR
ncbi:phosphate ABC transporter substrate-binding protein [Massilia brevitalea]|uniref:phosphate ABC transporter substrate-binding protein n=1 Tax=Massilia brevitalea TaxID=442526 RepID=UPI002739D7E7|nr:phosphate ABC transporter substrate-binding protein [Massilia brevitalea]